MTWASILKNTKSKNKINNLSKKNIMVETKKEENLITYNYEDDLENYLLEIDKTFDRQKSLILFDEIYNTLEEQKKYNYIAINLNCSDILVFFEKYIDKERSIKIKFNKNEITSENSDSEYDDYLEYY
tara:strand:- start:3733 stop:4116 length:384 start_codon:yes stop_codon:yes gene_type:complete